MIWWCLSSAEMKSSSFSLYNQHFYHNQIYTIPLSWILPPPPHIRVFPSAATTLTSLFHQRQQSNLLLSAQEQPVSTNVALCIPSMHTSNTDSVISRSFGGRGLALTLCPLKHFLSRVGVGNPAIIAHARAHSEMPPNNWDSLCSYLAFTQASHIKPFIGYKSVCCKCLKEGTLYLSHINLCFNT